MKTQMSKDYCMRHTAHFGATNSHIIQYSTRIHTTYTGMFIPSVAYICIYT